MTMLAPYPTDTRAKGWRFELDYEQIEQSSTWALAGPEGQAWALKLWLTGWRQVPCGSLPGDEEVITALLGMTQKQWHRHRKALMRGWIVADDGRMYHDTITVRVMEMLAKRRSDSDRQATRRAAIAAERERDSAGVTAASRVTPTGIGCESSTDHLPPKEQIQTPIPLTGDVPPLPQVSVLNQKPKTAKPEPTPEDVSLQVWSDWLALRKAKKAPVTPTVVAAARAEAGKAGMTFDAFLRVWCARGSQGLMADWLKTDERATARAPLVRPLTPGEARMLEACPSIVSESVRQRAAATAKPTFEVINAEQTTAARLG